MPIRHYDKIAYRKLPLIRALFATNLVFAVATLVAWQTALIHLLNALAWSADGTLPPERSLDQMLEYPLMLFWAGPAFAMAIAWMCIQGNNFKAAFGVLMLPVLAIMLSFALYFVLPT